MPSSGKALQRHSSLKLCHLATNTVQDQMQYAGFMTFCNFIKYSIDDQLPWLNIMYFHKQCLAFQSLEQNTNSDK